MELWSGMSLNLYYLVLMLSLEFGLEGDWKWTGANNRHASSSHGFDINDYGKKIQNLWAIFELSEQPIHPENI